MQTTTTNPSAQRVEPAHDILRQVRRRPLDSIFAPKVVAVIGATENKGSVGRTVFQNMGRGGFGGTVYPVNPKRAERALREGLPDDQGRAGEGGPGGADDAGATVPGFIRECVDAGVPAAVIISAGFKEMGPAGWNSSRR